MGQLSRTDMEKEVQKGGLKIIPLQENCIKAASYDLTPTIIAMSAKVGMLEKVYREPHFNEDRYYIFVHPKDTVLIVSNEYIIVPSNIAGYVSSRVSKLVDGFGHISTTIDPNWHGAALIALSNPSNRPLKVYVSGYSGVSGKQNQLATVTFHYLNTPCKNDDIDGMHRGMRLDLLERISYKNRSGVISSFRRCFLKRRRGFTDYFMTVCNERYEQLNEEVWDDFLNEFSYLNVNNNVKEEKYASKKAKMNTRDFIITENLRIRIFYWLAERQQIIKTLGILIFVVLAIIGVIPEEWLEWLSNLFS